MRFAHIIIAKRYERLTIAHIMSAPLLSARELATILRRHRVTVLYWARQGWIPCVRTSKRSVWFIEADVIEAMKKLNMKKGSP